MVDTALDQHLICHLTTRGRVTGRPHRIEIWFALVDDTFYLLSGGGESADWVANLRAHGSVRVEVGERVLDGRARVVADPGERQRARNAVHDKYAVRYGGDLTGWRDAALPVAIDPS